jgi:hypothetical protein
MTSLELIIIDKGTNLHITRKYDPNEIIHTINDKQYKVEQENLFLIQPWAFGRWRRKFVAIFTADGKPVTIEPAEEAKATSEILYLAERSYAFSKMAKALFARYFGTKKILFFFIIGAVGVVIYLVYTGQIKLP